mmetsp:Transcript_30163/g.39735  ORF Transcript_30163/g.39735 Transcript_30163/m.39735 type:complete len:680 (-) Transcript_30163:251-2290(-)
MELLRIHTPTITLCFLFLASYLFSSSIAYWEELSSLNSSLPVYFPSDDEYMESVVLPNHACKQLCPHAVVKPASTEEVSHLVKFCRKEGIPLSVRGTGNAYTCQAAKGGGLLLDMRGLDSLNINAEKLTMEVGAGMVWDQVLPHLNKQSLVAVHAQRTAIGVVGFSLHGGVHFGGLSELYGLASDNILASTIVIANGSAVRVSENHCQIDGIDIKAESCQRLWHAIRGAGSSFGIVTSLKIRLHHNPSNFISALSVISLETQDLQAAGTFLQKYLAIIPDNVSLTFFGLDSFSKAFFFVVKHARSRTQVVRQSTPLSQININRRPTIHFVIQASWLAVCDSDSACEKDPTMQILQAATDIVSESIFMEKSSNKKKNSPVYVPTGTATIPWVLAGKAFQIPLYDLALGTGQSYGVASITVDEIASVSTLKTAVSRFNDHQLTKSITGNTAIEVGGLFNLSSISPDGALNQMKFLDEIEEIGGCSDCVTILHRIGHGLANPSANTTAFNPFRQDAKLWLELHCGQPYRDRKKVPQCLAWIDQSQIIFDNAASEGHRSHYPHAPNLLTENWGSQYYGDKGFEVLKQIKLEWDPTNFFNHHQSIPLPKTIPRIQFFDRQMKPFHAGKFVDYLLETSQNHYNKWNNNAELKATCREAYRRKAQTGVGKRFIVGSAVAAFVIGLI